MSWNACMCAHRSAVLMQGRSLPGVSFGRLLHPADDTADAPDGAIRPTARHATTSHDFASRDFRRCGIEDLPLEWCDRERLRAPSRNGEATVTHRETT